MNRLEFKFELLWRTHLIAIVCILLSYVVVKEHLSINKWLLVAQLVVLLITSCWSPFVEYFKTIEVK